MNTIGIINYGSGNFSSVWNAFAHIKADMVELSFPEQLDTVDKLVLPGVGSFPACMKKLHEMGMASALEEVVKKGGKPYLGICVGMQVMAAMGYEFEPVAGLNMIPGSVRKIKTEKTGLRLPHIGWNSCRLKTPARITEGLGEEPIFYFVHSYIYQTERPEHSIAYCDYGDEMFPAIVQSENMIGVQFHPEKSQRDGLRLLRNFCTL